MKHHITLAVAFLVIMFFGSCRGQDCPATVLNAVDGSQMALIPAGEFTMGDALQFNAQLVYAVYLTHFTWMCTKSQTGSRSYL